MPRAVANCLSFNQLFKMCFLMTNFYKKEMYHILYLQRFGYLTFIIDHMRKTFILD